MDMGVNMKKFNRRQLRQMILKQLNEATDSGGLGKLTKKGKDGFFGRELSSSGELLKILAGLHGTPAMDKMISEKGLEVALNPFETYMVVRNYSDELVNVYNREFEAAMKSERGSTSISDAEIAGAVAAYEKIEELNKHM